MGEKIGKLEDRRKKRGPESEVRRPETEEKTEDRSRKTGDGEKTEDGSKKRSVVKLNPDEIQFEYNVKQIRNMNRGNNKQSNIFNFPLLTSLSRLLSPFY